MPGGFALEVSVQRAGDVDNARSLLPAPASLLKLARSTVFRVTGFTLLAVRTIELQSREARRLFYDSIARHCTLEMRRTFKLVKE